MAFRGPGSNFILSDGKGAPPWGSSLSSCSWSTSHLKVKLLFYIVYRFVFCLCLTWGPLPSRLPYSSLCLHDLVGMYWGPAVCPALSGGTTSDRSLTGDRDGYQVTVRQDKGHQEDHQWDGKCVLVRPRGEAQNSETCWWGPRVGHRTLRCQGKCLTDWEIRVEVNARAV